VSGQIGVGNLALFAVQWGKDFQRRLNDAGLGVHYKPYCEQYPLRVSPDAASHFRDPGAEQLAGAIGQEVADGVAILFSVLDGSRDTWLDSAPVGDKPALKAIASAFALSHSEKLKRIFNQPESDPDTAWLPEHLEYQFSVASPVAGQQQQVLLAEQYHHRRLDLYSFDLARDRQMSLEGEAPSTPPVDQVESFLPANVRFKGQPQPRFWQMKESQTDFGKIETSTTGLSHLMLAEFGVSVFERLVHAASSHAHQHHLSNSRHPG
jgi:hypothetical protein